MSLDSALQALDGAMADDLVEAKLREVLREAANDAASLRVELGEAEGGHVDVPLDARFEIVTKAFIKEYLRPTVGDFRVQVAIGGAHVSPEGAMSARFCFATLWFNAQGQRFTTDFHLKVR